MRYHSIKQMASLCLLGAALACPSISRGQPYTIAPGWDLFTTATPPTMFDNIPFQGVPLGTFNFGGSIGIQNVGNTDTIIQRLTPITGSSGGTVSFTADLAALQLVSVNPVSIGGGPVGYYFLTLQSERGGTASTDSGLMYFNPDNTGGTFTDTLNVYYDLRFGSLIGPIVSSSDVSLVNAGTTWTHDGSYPPVIPGVNQSLNGGSDTSGDFWAGEWTVADQSGDMILVPNPEPSSLALLCVGVLCLAIKTRRGRK